MLDEWDGTCPLTCAFGPAAPAECHGWFDAATLEDHGVGGVLWDEAKGELYGFSRAWTEEERKLAQHEKKRESTGVLETHAALAWVTVFGPRCARCRTLLRTDSQAAMLAARKAFSPSDAMLDALRDLRAAIGRHHIRLLLRQVKGDVFNIIADHLSHLRVEEAKECARRVFGVDMRIVDAWSPAASRQ